MSHAHRALGLLAALLLSCAQGCRAGEPRAAASTPEPAPTPAAPQSAAPQSSAAASPTPTRPAPPFPARDRGHRAFEPFINLSGGRRFESREVEQKPVRKDLEFGANYPVLLGDDSRAARDFNRRTRAIVMEDVKPYLKDRSDPDKDRMKGVDMEHHVTHKVVYATDEVVSVLFYATGYSTPAAHGYHFPVTFNFDLRAGREIELAQVFKPRSGYLRTIAKLCAEDIERQFGWKYPSAEGTTFARGAEPKPDNYASWVVTRGGLVFIFHEYQVMSYVDGEPKVLVPFASVREIINPRSALARPAANE
jgi:hypothetical protein